MTPWRALMEVCQEREIAPTIIVRPRDYRDDRSATERAAVIRLMRAKGIPVKVLAEITGLSQRTVFWILSEKRGAPAATVETQNAI